MRLVLPVMFQPASLQYSAYCPECHGTVATWTAEWLALHQKSPPLAWEHICPQLNRHRTQHPAEYVEPDATHPTTQEN